MNGWEFDPPGKGDSPERDHGLTLRYVSHDGHPFADELGVAAIWINPGGADGGRHGPFVLGPGDFYLLGDVDTESTAAPAPFDGYAIERAMRQRYVSRTVKNDPVLGDGHPPLSIEQSYRFSAYGTDPPHEPTGILPAARIFPYVTFRTLNPRIRSIRIDYRMNFVFTRPVFVKDRIPQFINLSPKTQAGVFRDRDDISSLATIPGLRQIGAALAPTTAAEQIFAAAEKPVQYEILGFGLRDGVGEKTWDNIHIWPKGERLPSAPGTFHAGHMHWRWGKPISEPTKEEIKQQHHLGVMQVGLKQFKGVPPSGALLDPSIPNQTIRFAITRSMVRQAETPEKFEELCTRRKTPEKIEDGDDLDVWLSFEVKRGPSASSVFYGTTFIHGLYFPHEEESPLNTAAFTEGVALAVPPPAQEWERNPK